MAWSESERRKRRRGCGNPKGFTMRQFCRNQRSRSGKGEKTNEALLRQLIREALSSKFPLTERQLVRLAEYVGANEPIPSSVITALEPMMERHEGLLRVWSDVPTPVTDAELLRIARQRGHIACTRDPEVIERMIEEEGWEYRLGRDDGLIITRVDGIGFDPIEALERGLDAYPESSEHDYIRTVIDTHLWQDEVVIVEPTRITTEL